MVKLVYVIRRRADVTPEAFRRYWLEQHGPRVRGHAAALGAVRYVQSHTGEDDLNALLRASRGSAPPFDGITEVWWPSRAALEAGLATPEGQEAGRDLLADETRFIDFAASSLFLTEEHEIF